MLAFVWNMSDGFQHNFGLCRHISVLVVGRGVVVFRKCGKFACVNIIFYEISTNEVKKE